MSKRKRPLQMADLRPLRDTDSFGIETVGEIFARNLAAFNDDPHTITSGRLWDGDLLATYRRAHAQVVAAIAAGLRDAGLTDEATIDRLTAAVVKRLGEG